MAELVIVSCDPGLTGAFCLYDVKRGTMTLHDTPTFMRAVAGAKKPRKTLDEEGVVDLLRGFMLLGATHFVIEQVQGLPRQSAPAAFTFGVGYGVCRTAAALLGMQVERVRPQVWKTALRVPADKAQSRARASELIPTHKHLWVRAGQDGRAEAAMLALWAQQHFQKGRGR